MLDVNDARLSLFPILAGKSKNKHIERTTLMEYLYLLQIVRGISLGYHFTLFSYGPFDSDVLSDLSIAESLKAVEIELKLYSGGYEYQIRPGKNAKWLERRAKKFVARYYTDINWIMRKFGNFTNAELELVGTIIYVDWEMIRKNKTISLDRMTKLIHEIKPYFAEAKILKYVQQLVNERILKGLH